MLGYLSDPLQVHDRFLLLIFDKLQAWDISYLVLAPSKKDSFLQVLSYLLPVWHKAYILKLHWNDSKIWQAQISGECLDGCHVGNI